MFSIQYLLEIRNNDLKISYVRLALIISILTVLSSCGLKRNAPGQDSRHVSRHSYGPVSSPEGSSADFEPKVNPQASKNAGETAKKGLNRRSTGIKPGGAAIEAIFGLSGGKLLFLSTGGVSFQYDPLEGGERELWRGKNNLRETSYHRGKNLLAFADLYGLQVIDLSTGEQIAEVDLRAKVTALDFDPEGESLLVGAADGRVYRWPFFRDRTGRDHQLERYIGSAAIISAVRFHPGGRVFFSGDWEGGLSAWLSYGADNPSGFIERSLFDPGTLTKKGRRVRGARTVVDSIEDILVTKSGQRLIVGYQDGSIELRSIRGFSVGVRKQAHLGLLTAISLNSRGDSIATAGRDGVIRVWEIVEKRGGRENQTTFELLQKLELAEKGVRSLFFLYDDQLVAGTAQGELISYRLMEKPDRKVLVQKEGLVE